MAAKYLFRTALLLLPGAVHAQTTINGSFVHDGTTRTYSFYVPASYSAGTAVPLVLNLHGLGTDGDYQAEYRDFRPIADTAGFIVAHPDGTTLFGQRFWNYGNVLGSTVDDVGFLEALIDTISAGYSVDPQRIYCAGMSNGSFMCYYLACQSDRFAAIGAVTGSMSTDMYDACAPQHAVPVIHVHGTDDSVNPYEGTSTMQGIDDVIRFWVDLNDCDTIPAVTQLPDIGTADNSAAARYLYTGGIDGHTVELFKVTGGGHAWPGSPAPGSSETTCMDFDASRELWRFFSQHALSGTAAVASPQLTGFTFWPNPASTDITIRVAGDQRVTAVSICDVYGRVILEKTAEHVESVDVQHLRSGNYTVTVSGEGFCGVKKLVVR